MADYVDYIRWHRPTFLLRKPPKLKLNRKQFNKLFISSSHLQFQMLRGLPSIRISIRISSTVVDFDLGCGVGPTVKSLSNTLFWAFFGIVGVLAGPIGDKTGRKPVGVVCSFFCLLATFATAFAPNLVVYLPLRMACGFFLGGLHNMIYITMSETVKKKILAKVAMGSMFIISLGQLVTVFAGYLMQSSWRMHVAVVAVLMVPFLLYHIFCFPESQIWKIYHKPGRGKKLRFTQSAANKAPLIKGEDRDHVDKLRDSKTQLQENALQKVSASPENVCSQTKPVNILDLFATFQTAMLTVFHTFLIVCGLSLLCNRI